MTIKCGEGVKKTQCVLVAKSEITDKECSNKRGEAAKLLNINCNF